MENLGNAAEAAVKRWEKLEKYACLLFLIVIAGMLIRNIGFSEEIDQQSKAAVLLENGETLTCDVQVRGEMTQYPLKKDKAALVEQLSIWCGDRLVVEFQNISGALAFSTSYRYTGILNREEGWLLAELDGKTILPEKAGMRCLILLPDGNRESALRILDGINLPAEYETAFSWLLRDR